jgi:hypothetical protein
MLVLKNPAFRLSCDKRAGCGFSFRSVRALGARSERQADEDAERTKEARRIRRARGLLVERAAGPS